MAKRRPRRDATTPETREPRINVHGKVQVEIGLTGQFPEITGWAKNLNTRGMSMWCDQQLPVDAECSFRLFDTENNLTIDGTGWVVYQNENGMAIQFDEFPPESLETLAALLARSITPSNPA